jgi:hypothetical protein
MRCMGATYGTICLSNGAIWLLYSAHGSHMAPIWPPNGACSPMWCHPPPLPVHDSNMAPRWHMRLPYSHSWLPYGPYTAQGATIWRHPPCICHTWHPYVVGSSTHLSSIWHCMASIWHAWWLPYGAHGSCTVHTAPLRRTWLPYGTVGLPYCSTYTWLKWYLMSYTESRVTTHCNQFSKNITGIITVKKLSKALQLKF